VVSDQLTAPIDDYHELQTILRKTSFYHTRNHSNFIFLTSNF